MRALQALLLLSLVSATFLSAAPLRAEDPPSAAMTGPLSQMINVPQLVENYARFLARKYELNEQQEKSTVDILQKRTQEFLTNHEQKIFDLYNTMLAVRGGGDMDPEELIDWGKTAMPIYQDAKEIIVGGNAEWRQLLTDEQRKLHDEDVKLMYESFQTTDDQLTRIVTGEMTVDEFRNPPRPNRRRRNRQAVQDTNPPAAVAPAPVPAGDAGAEVHAPNTPGPEGVMPQPEHTADEGAMPGQTVEGVNPDQVEAGHQSGDQTPDGTARTEHDQGAGGPGDAQQRRGSRGRPAATTEQFASEWERYVNEFIQRYKLDDSQEQAARKILRDCQDQGKRYLASKRAQLDTVDTQLAGAATGKDGAKVSQKLRTQREQLMGPISRIFEKQLKPRIDRIPTRSQRQAAEKPPAPPAHAAPPARPAKSGSKP